MLNDFFKRNIELWGIDKFQTLQNSTVAICGAGGLCSNLANILVRSGIGKIYLIDFATIDPPDLNRQSLYTVEDISKKKVEVASEKLNNIFKTKVVCPIFSKIDKNFRFPEDTTLVADCLDNFNTRFSLDDSVKKGIPVVSGGVGHDYGQIISFTMGINHFKNIFPNLSDSNNQKPLPVSAELVIAVASIMAKEIFNVLWKQPVLNNKFLVVEFSDFSFSKIEISIN